MHCHVYDHQPRKHGRTCLPVHPMTGGTRSVQSARSSNRTPLAARILSRYVALAIGLIPVVVHAQITTTIEGRPVNPAPLRWCPPSLLENAMDQA